MANRLARDLELPAKPDSMKAVCGLETGCIVYRSHLISFKFLDPLKSNALHCVFSEADRRPLHSQKAQDSSESAGSSRGLQNVVLTGSVGCSKAGQSVNTHALECMFRYNYGKL